MDCCGCCAPRKKLTKWEQSQRSWLWALLAGPAPAPRPGQLKGQAKGQAQPKKSEEPTTASTISSPPGLGSARRKGAGASGALSKVSILGIIVLFSTLSFFIGAHYSGPARHILWDSLAHTGYTGSLSHSAASRELRQETEGSEKRRDRDRSSAATNSITSNSTAASGDNVSVRTSEGRTGDSTSDSGKGEAGAGHGKTRHGSGSQKSQEGSEKERRTGGETRGGKGKGGEGRGEASEGGGGDRGGKKRRGGRGEGEGGPGEDPVEVADDQAQFKSLVDSVASLLTPIQEGGELPDTTIDTDTKTNNTANRGPEARAKAHTDRGSRTIFNKRPRTNSNTSTHTAKKHQWHTVGKVMSFKLAKQLYPKVAAMRARELKEKRLKFKARKMANQTHSNSSSDSGARLSPPGSLPRLSSVASSGTPASARETEAAAKGGQPTVKRPQLPPRLVVVLKVCAPGTPSPGTPSHPGVLPWYPLLSLGGLAAPMRHPPVLVLRLPTRLLPFYSRLLPCCTAGVPLGTAGSPGGAGAGAVPGPCICRRPPHPAHRRVAPHCRVPPRGVPRPVPGRA